MVAKHKAMVKLGAGAFADRRLSRAALEAGLSAGEEIARLLEGLGVEQTVAVATSAVREATNGRAFLRAWRDRTGIPATLISGREEARLIGRAVTESLPLAAPALVVDIGGGSTELAVTEREEATWSLPLGVQRLLGEVGHDGPLTGDERRRLEDHILALCGGPVREASGHDLSRAVGTSGTVKALAELALGRRDGRSPKSLTGVVLERDELATVVDALCITDRGGRRELGVDERRADSLHLGGLVALQILEVASLHRLTLCESALREGVIAEEIAPAPRAVTPGLDLRERSVRHLMGKGRVDRARADHIAMLAGQLFEQTKAIHGLSDDEGDLLAAAARLHPLGRWLNHRRCHKHSRYLIQNAKLPGFSPREQLVLSHVARYHRKKGPKGHHKKLGRLDEEDQRVVFVLAGILRVAVALDYSHNQGVVSVATGDDGRTLTVVVSASTEPTLEMKKALAKAPTLAFALARVIRFEHELAP